MWKEILSANLEFMLNNDNHTVPLDPQVAYANADTNSKPLLLPAPLPVLRYNELWTIARVGQ